MQNFAAIKSKAGSSFGNQIPFQKEWEGMSSRGQNLTWAVIKLKKKKKKPLPPSFFNSSLSFKRLCAINK